ncbi:hypothetical protein [Treponema sp. R6D11]
MKKIAFIILILLPCFAFAEDVSLDFGVVNFFMDTKILKDGSITNVGLGLKYKDNWGGEIRGKFEKTAKNEDLNDDFVVDSLIATNETIYEATLLPIQYRKAINQNSQWKAGAGLYYYYQETYEKGYLDMPELETIGRARVNSYMSDLSMHLLGPIIDIGIRYNTEILVFNLTGGVVPVFYLKAAEEQRMRPLYDTVNHKQHKWGSPYVFVDMDCVLFEYVNLGAKYEYTKLKYDVIKLEGFKPSFPESTRVNQSINLEASVILPFQSIGLGLQVGYGYNINIITTDSNDPIKYNKPYFIISGRLLSPRSPSE